MKPAVARAALAAGASIVNDVAANREDGAMWRLWRNFGPVMFACTRKGRRGRCREIRLAATWSAKSANFSANGWAIERLRVSCRPGGVGPGIGFGKTLEHNLQLLANLRSFTKMARPLLLGVSRKSFIGKLLGRN
jgi:dihydropteroate synthase